MYLYYYIHSLWTAEWQQAMRNLHNLLYIHFVFTEQETFAAQSQCSSDYFKN